MKKFILSSDAVVLLFVITIIAILLISVKQKHDGVWYKQPHRVVKVERHIPRNVHEEMNLYYDVTLETGLVMKSLKQVSVGDTIYFEFYKVKE